MATPIQYSCLENSMNREPGMQCVGSQRVGHDWATNSFTLFTFSTITDVSSIPGNRPCHVWTQSVPITTLCSKYWRPLNITEETGLGQEMTGLGCREAERRSWNLTPGSSWFYASLCSDHVQSRDAGPRGLYSWGIILDWWSCDHTDGNRKGKVYET